ncbi:MAG: hypothetical protein KatS3mg129_0873 [Leptospiraceae bacterium]|nr:MAG: hypothetical protein KatS3mg129_0873 [Leptospiraceae bacterium]
MIKIENLNKIYKKHQVLKNIYLELENQNIIALLGPNGSGKTTLIKCLLGLVIPEKHSKLFLNNQLIEFNLPKYLNIGYVPQTPHFPSNLKVNDLIEYLVSFEKDFPIYLDDLLKDLNINSFLNKKVGELSGGMKQKINLLQCFMSPRDIYILDEPTASLDPYHSFYLKKLIKTIKEHAMILFTTHILSEVEELADQMFILIDGEIRFKENPKDFIFSKNAQNLEEALSNIKEYIKI